MNAQLLAQLRTIRYPSDLLDCLQALQNHFSDDHVIGEALTDAILVIEEELNEPEDSGICPACDGSGEGMHEGTRCTVCRGKGE